MKNNVNKPKDTKDVKIYKIIDIVLCVIIFTILILQAIATFVLGKESTFYISLSYFFEHFSIGLCLVLIGCIALTQPHIYKNNLSSPGSSDDVMTKVGILTIIVGIMTVFLTYMGFLDL